MPEGAFQRQDRDNWSWGWSGASTPRAPHPRHTHTFSSIPFENMRLKSGTKEQIFTYNFKPVCFSLELQWSRPQSHSILAMTGGISRLLEASGRPVLVCGPAPHRLDHHLLVYALPSSRNPSLPAASPSPLPNSPSVPV